MQDYGHQSRILAHRCTLVLHRVHAIYNITYATVLPNLEYLPISDYITYCPMKSHTIVNKKTVGDHLPKSQLSEEPQSISGLENNQSNLISMGQTMPRKGHQIDNYEGPVDPKTRLRHGFGLYRYQNKYFTFEGEYQQGVKSGKGVFKLGDGTLINGIFTDNQLTGEAEIAYADGSSYKGGLKNGEKSGQGCYRSKLQSYEGGYLQNKRHGTGILKTSTCTISGPFLNNKPDGEGVAITKYNYKYEGSCRAGRKNGYGKQVSTYVDDNFAYDGEYKEDKFNGEGRYETKGATAYCYVGHFESGKPSLYPNKFRVLLGLSSGADSQKPAIQTFSNISSEQTLGTVIEYELEAQNKLHFAIQTCFQGPEKLDPNQPTEQEIEKLIKDWQNENKKNKNPPPMPDFRQPRKIKPELIIVQQQVLRPIEIRLIKVDGNEDNLIQFKVDYRELIKKKRAENQVLRAQAMKKAEEQGNKKGGKGGAKNEIQLKVNVFVEKPSDAEKVLKVESIDGKSFIDNLQLPDDFPPGAYQLRIFSPFTLFGPVKQFRKSINIKPKNAGGKKK